MIKKQNNKELDDVHVILEKNEISKRCKTVFNAYAAKIKKLNNSK